MSQKEGVLIYSSSKTESGLLSLEVAIYNNAFQNLMGFQRDEVEGDEYLISEEVLNMKQFKIKEKKVLRTVSLKKLIKTLTAKNIDIEI
jgi:hypothetical protein